MPYKLTFTKQAKDDLEELSNSPQYLKQYKAVQKSLGLLQQNPRHQGLHTHKFKLLYGPRGEEVFVAYAESKTPAAFRIFWYYGPGKDLITIFAITPHP